MTPDQIKIKKLLHCGLFRPYAIKDMDEDSSSFSEVNTKIKILKSDINMDYINQVMKKQNLTWIQNCYFIGGQNESVFCLYPDHEKLDVFSSNFLVMRCYAEHQVPNKILDRDESAAFVRFIKKGGVF